jgi:hypothetical protein
MLQAKNRIVAVCYYYALTPADRQVLNHLPFKNYLYAGYRPFQFKKMDR